MRDSTPHWQKILANGFSSAQELLKNLNLSPSLGSHLADQSFKTRVPRRFAAKMEPGNPKDPLLLQVLATHQELQMTAGYDSDPLQEATANPIPGLIHKYPNRVLLTITGVCAINCRFCFRRHFPYTENNPGQLGWQQAMTYIQQHPNIHEVILSGGDPLLASDQTLERLFASLAEIEHVQTIRFHTRVPIVLPERIQKDFIKLVTTKRFRMVVVVHCNHPNELDDAVQQACAQMQQAGCLLLNQSVLLKEINDHSKILANLSQRLFAYGILPYYLHLLDPVQGAQHFDLDLDAALTIYQDLQSQLPGYLVPKLVRERAGMPYKMIMGS
ncbi:MAG: EF-P beta-lysylation protein EpmB [Legionellales bacterium]|nr:EF-P beta-lysylation protein EpmB [Legionellales bacterium]